ncbi:MAG: SAM-dependent methyltransferase, partial [Pseudanabaena sp.]
MVISSPTPTFLEGYWQDGFRLEQHLQEFLKLDAATITEKLQNCRYDLENLGNTDFDWEEATAFYKDKVGEMYLFKLGPWHLESQYYIGGTIKLIADQAKGRVLDFGGGIGTHAIAAAMCPNVDSVIYCDINPINRGFVEHRVAQLGLSHKISFRSEIPLEAALEGYFDTV